MTDSMKLRLDLPLVLPDVDDVEDRCVSRLVGALSGRPGIAEAHVVAGAGSAPQLCIHYDPAAISLTRVRELVQSVGAQLSERFSHVLLRIDEPLHARAARRVADGLRSVAGVLEADVAGSGAVRIEYDRERVSEQALLDKAVTLGVHLSGIAAAPRVAAAASEQPYDHADADHRGHVHAKDSGDHAGHDHADGGLFGEKTELVFAALAGVLLTAGWLIERAASGPGWLPTACYIAAYFLGGFYTV